VVSGLIPARLTHIFAWNTKTHTVNTFAKLSGSERLRLLIYMERIWEAEYRRLGARGEGEKAGAPSVPIVSYTGSERWTAPLSLAEVVNVPWVL